MVLRVSGIEGYWWSSSTLVVVISQVSQCCGGVAQNSTGPFSVLSGGAARTETIIGQEVATESVIVLVACAATNVVQVEQLMINYRHESAFPR